MNHQWLDDPKKFLLIWITGSIILLGAVIALVGIAGFIKWLITGG